MYVEYLLVAALLISVTGASIGYLLWNRMSEARLLKIRVRRLHRQLVAAREMAKKIGAEEDVDRAFAEALSGISRIHRKIRPGKTLPSMFMSLEMTMGELMGHLHLGNKEQVGEIAKRVSQKIRGIELELEESLR